jgi:3-methyladenine DNA glycosylase/8-oxoguanine DNA glycosylase
VETDHRYLFVLLASTTEGLPLGDIAVKWNTFERITWIILADKELMYAHAQQWSPYRSYATYFFVASLLKQTK